jgi:mRNA interferase HigB
MRIINQPRLADFALNHSDSVKSINKWAVTMINGQYKSSHDLLMDYPSADYVGNDRYVFDIKGNRSESLQSLCLSEVLWIYVSLEHMQSMKK